MIDICIPYWGDPGLMRKTVESVLAQDCDHWILTVVDDAYADSSIGDWLRGMDHPRVRYLRNDSNLGIVGNYQKLLGMTTQELVMLLGCDDELMPQYVSTILAAHEKHPGASVIHPGINILDETGRKVSTLADWAKMNLVMPKTTDQLLGGESLAISLLNGDWMYWPALTFKTLAIKKFEFDPKLKLTHDLAIVMDMVVAGEKLLLVSEVCFSYRRHSQSASTLNMMNGKRFAEERIYFSHAKALMKEAGWRRAERAVDWHFTSRANAFWIAGNALFKGQWNALPGLIGHVFNVLD